MRQTIVLITIMIFQMGFDAASKKETESLSFFCIYYISPRKKKTKQNVPSFVAFEKLKLNQQNNSCPLSPS